MYNQPNLYPYPYYVGTPVCPCGMIPRTYYDHLYYHSFNVYEDNRAKLKDHGKEPFVINIENAAEENETFRTTIWTGNNLQVTVMSIRPSEDVGLEVHPNVDQFLRIEEGHGIVQMGNVRDNLYFERYVYEDDAIMVPAGIWHNVTNTGNEQLKLYTIYAPPEHPYGTVHKTKAEAIAAESNHY